MAPEATACLWPEGSSRTFQVEWWLSGLNMAVERKWTARASPAAGAVGTDETPLQPQPSRCKPGEECPQKGRGPAHPSMSDTPIKCSSWACLSFISHSGRGATAQTRLRSAALEAASPAVSAEVAAPSQPAACSPGPDPAQPHLCSAAGKDVRCGVAELAGPSGQDPAIPETLDQMPPTPMWLIGARQGPGTQDQDAAPVATAHLLARPQLLATLQEGPPTGAQQACSVALRTQQTAAPGAHIYGQYK